MSPSQAQRSESLRPFRAVRFRVSHRKLSSTRRAEATNIHAGGDNTHNHYSGRWNVRIACPFDHLTHVVLWPQPMGAGYVAVLQPGRKAVTDRSRFVTPEAYARRGAAEEEEAGAAVVGMDQGEAGLDGLMMSSSDA
jgi:hypothetical protein